MNLLCLYGLHPFTRYHTYLITILRLEFASMSTTRRYSGCKCCGEPSKPFTFWSA